MNGFGLESKIVIQFAKPWLMQTSKGMFKLLLNMPRYIDQKSWFITFHFVLPCLIQYQIGIQSKQQKTFANTKNTDERMLSKTKFVLRTFTYTYTHKAFFSGATHDYYHKTRELLS